MHITFINFLQGTLMIISKRKWLISALAVLSLTACENGQQSNSNLNTGTTVAAKTIAVSDQVYTPASISAKLGTQSATLSGDSSCFVIVPQSDGKNYSSSIVSSSQWWSSASVGFSIKNKCNTPQSLGNTVVLSNVKIQSGNSTLIPSSFSTAQDSATGPYLAISSALDSENVNVNLSTPSCSGDYCSWADVPANTTYAITVLVNNGGPIDAITLDGVSIKGATPTPPVTSGELDLTVNSSDLQTLCSSQACNIKVKLLSPTSDVLHTENINPLESQAVTFPYTGLLPGSYTVAVDSLPQDSNGTVSTKYLPASSVSVSSGSVSHISVQFIYTPNAVKPASVNVSLPSIAASPSFANLAGVLVNIVDTTESSNTISPVAVALGGNVEISNLVAGHVYKLHAQGVADPATGSYYQAIDQTVTAQSNSVQNVNFSYKAVTANLSKVTFTVNNGNSSQTVTFGSNSQTYKYVVDSLKSGVYTFANDDVVVLNVSELSGYTSSISPQSVISNGQPSAVTINYAQNSTTGKHLVVGYIDGTATGAVAQIPASAYSMYDVLIIGFSNCSATNTVCANIDNSTINTTTEHGLLNAFQYASANAKPNAVLMLSIGGQYGSSGFSNNNVNTTALASGIIDSINAINANITTPLKITGVDLDVEASGSSENLLALAKILHDKGYLVSVAPQAGAASIPINPSSPSNFVLTGSGISNDYAPLVAAGYADYINLQAYNNGSQGMSISTEAGSVSVETDPSFHQYIAQTMNTLTSDNCGTLGTNGNYANGYPVCIPSKTNVIIGTVANYGAGGTTMWTNENHSPAGNAAILAQFNDSVQVAKTYPHYNGVMVWALTNDYYPSAWLSDTWDPVGAFTNNIPNFGF